MLQAIIFDLDGVVVDSHPAHKRAWKALLQSVGKDASDHELLFILDGKKREDILRHFLGDLSAEQVKRYGAKKEALFRDSARDLKTVAGLPEFLDNVESAGLPMALASSASRSRVSYTLEHLDLQHHFRAVLSGDDVIKGKPDPSIFQLAARSLRVEPSHILVCEDAVSGVEAAKAAGMKCLGIAAGNRGPMLRRAGADRVVADFRATSLDDLRTLFGSSQGPRTSSKSRQTQKSRQTHGDGESAC